MLKVDIADERADIFSLILFIAHEFNIDLHEALCGMLKTDEQKFSQRVSLEKV